jgi:phosphoglycerate dehydrogenase-like enzyme
MQILAYDPFWPEAFAREHAIASVALDDLLRRADIVSLHLPLTDETRGLLDARALSLMKPGAFLINAARGGIVNEQDLCTALRDGIIAGAGIDVFAQEPPTDSPLMTLDNVLVSPHTAAFTREAMRNMDAAIIDQILAFVSGGRPAHTVNPETLAGL